MVRCGEAGVWSLRERIRKGGGGGKKGDIYCMGQG